MDLEAAISTDDSRAAENLITDVDIASWRNEDEEKAIVIACKYDAVKVFKLILSTFSINERDRRGRSLTEVAVEESSVGVLRILLEEGADLTTSPQSAVSRVPCLRCTFTQKCLMDVALNIVLHKHRFCFDDKRKACQVVNLLYEKGFKLPEKSSDGSTVVDEFLRHKVEDPLLYKLIKSGHEMTLSSPVTHALFFPFPESLLQCLFTRGCDINTVSSEFGYPALYFVCGGIRHSWEDSSLALLELLLEHGADVNIQSSTLAHSKKMSFPNLIWTQGLWLTALHIAAVSKSDHKSDLVYTLCKHGSNVNAQTDSGDTPLMLAVKNLLQYEEYGFNFENEIDISTVEILLQSGADPDIRNIRGDSCVRVALELGGFQKVKLMMLDTFVCHGHFKDLEFGDVSVPNLSSEELKHLCTSPRNLRTLSRNAILKTTSGRHFQRGDSLNFLPNIVADYIKMDYYYQDWLNNPWTL